MQARFPTSIVLAWVILACTLPGFAAGSRPPNIVLITLDTTRADRMGFLGAIRGLTPNLDTLAKHGVVFTRAYAHVPLTTASHATILSGTYPQFNRVNDFGKPLLSDVPYLPELLHKDGYRTAAFVGSLVLDPIGGAAPGFDRGFDVFDAGFRMRRASEDRYQTVERRAETVVAHALRWLVKNGHGPFFLWVHLYDAHDHYNPPEPWATRYKLAPYDGEIAYVDFAVGKLLSALRAQCWYENAFIAVMADHGEGLGEHGENTHGIFLYDETIHVPLLFKLPGAHSAGKRLATRVGLVDVTPTILQAAGLNVPVVIQGKSLLALMGLRGSGTSANNSHSEIAADSDRPAYAETDYSHRAFGWSPLRSLRSGKYLFVQAPRLELYDQSADPQASRNLAPRATAVTQTLASQLNQFRHSSSANSNSGAQAGVDPQLAQKLNALGYVASDSNSADTKARENGPDPKDKIEIANLMHDALLDVENGRYQEAVPLLERTVAEQPQMPIAQMQLGIALARLKDFAKAIPPLQKTVELLPDSGMGHYEFGLALFETGDWKAAAPQFEAAVARAPRWADAHFSLASVYARIDRVPEAMRELNTTLKLNPDHYRANLLRGRILSLQGDASAALPDLQKAVQAEPNSREAHLFLSEAYAQLGQDENARQQRAEAQRLTPAGH